MTAYSLRILAWPNDEDPNALSAPGLDTHTVQGLARYAERCGPYGLAAWANARGAPLYYVDNCWVRAKVLGRGLTAFFNEVLAGEARPSTAIGTDRTYLIEAEEY